VGNAAYLNADKVHLNQAGHNIVTSTVVSSGLVTTISTNRRTPFRTHDDVVKFAGDSLFFKWKMRSRGNYALRYSTNNDEITTGPLLMDSVSAIMSLSTRPTKPLSTMLMSFEGAVASYGNQGSYFTFDRTTPGNYYGWYSDNNILRFLYNGTDRAYLNTIGALRLGNASSPIISGILQIKNNQTLTGTLGTIGVNLNVDTTITTAPNTGHTFFAANSIGPHSVISTSSGNTATATNFYIADSVVASTNHAFTGTSYALYINKGKFRIGTTDSVGTATGGYLFKDFATGTVKITGAPSGGSGITSINGETGAAQTLTATNGLTRTTTSNNVEYKLGGTLTENTTILGGTRQLSLGTAGDKLGATSIVASSASVISDNRLNLFGGITYLAVQHTADANLSMNISTGVLELATGSLTTDRTITLPTAQVHGQVLTIVVRFASSGSHYVLSAAVEDIKTGSTFTQLDWGTTYDFMVNASIGWMLIRKY
jgi:hypothetical protein